MAECLVCLHHVDSTSIRFYFRTLNYTSPHHQQQYCFCFFSHTFTLPLRVVIIKWIRRTRKDLLIRVRKNENLQEEKSFHLLIIATFHSFVCFFLFPHKANHCFYLSSFMRKNLLLFDEKSGKIFFFYSTENFQIFFLILK